MKVFQALAIWMVSSICFAEVTLLPRFIYVLHGGVDAVWGQYMFMVRNGSEAPLDSEFKVAIPEETVDWQAQEGLEGIQFSLGEKGGLIFSKKFKPGDNIHTLGFKAPATGGKGNLTITMPMDVAEISFMTTGDIVVEGENIQVSKRGEGQKYDKYHFYNVKKGDSISIGVSGIHVGRSQFWTYGWAAGVVLIVGGLGLAYYTRPKQMSEV